MPKKKFAQHSNELYHVTLIVLSVSILIIVSVLSFWNARLSTQMRMEIQELRNELQVDRSSAMNYDFDASNQFAVSSVVVSNYDVLVTSVEVIGE